MTLNGLLSTAAICFWSKQWVWCHEKSPWISFWRPIWHDTTGIKRRLIQSITAPNCDQRQLGPRLASRFAGGVRRLAPSANTGRWICQWALRVNHHQHGKRRWFPPQSISLAYTHTHTREGTAGTQVSIWHMQDVTHTSRRTLRRSLNERQQADKGCVYVGAPSGIMRCCRQNSSRRVSHARVRSRSLSFMDSTSVERSNLLFGKCQVWRGSSESDIVPGWMPSSTRHRFSFTETNLH